MQKNFFLNLYVCAFWLIAGKAYSADSEFIAGAAYEEVEYDEPQARNYGLSLRYRHVWAKPGSKGAYARIDALGNSLLVSDVSAGYMYRSAGTTFFDAGAGVGIGLVWGLFADAFVGIGQRLSSRAYVVLPIMIRYPGRAGIYISPLIGWRF